MYRLFLFEYSICVNLDKIIIVLFESRKPVTIPLKDGEVFYDPCFFKNKEANNYFEILKKDIEWQQDDIKIFGKVYAQPRLTALYANNNNPYRYSNITMYPKKFSPTHQKHIALPKGSLDLTSNTYEQVKGIINCIIVPPRAVMKSPKKLNIKCPAS